MRHLCWPGSDDVSEADEVLSVGSGNLAQRNDAIKRVFARSGENAHDFKMVGKVREQTLSSLI